MPDSPKTDAASAARTAQATAQNTAQNAFNAGKDGFKRASDDASRFASRSADLGAQTMNAYVESGKQTSQLLGDVNKAMTDAYTKSLAEFNELSKQALSCRTVQDVVTLQTNAMQAFQDNLSAAAEINRLLVNGFTQAMSPIASRAQANLNTAAADANSVA